MFNINKLFDSFWGTIIEKLHIDMENHTIRLLIRSNDEGVETFTDIILEEVVAFCWINESFHQDKGRLDIEKWNFIQLESIGYEDNIRVIIEGGEWESSFSALPNIVLEIWNSILLIEAKKVIINGETYELIKNNLDDNS